MNNSRQDASLFLAISGLSIGFQCSDGAVEKGFRFAPLSAPFQHWNYPSMNSKDFRGLASPPLAAPSSFCTQCALGACTILLAAHRWHVTIAAHALLRKLSMDWFGCSKLLEQKLMTQAEPS
jgi:hypothetical protein